MAYFDTDKIAAPATETRATLSKMVKGIVATFTQALPKSTRSPEDMVAAQRRAELARRKVDNLMR